MYKVNADMDALRRKGFGSECYTRIMDKETLAADATITAPNIGIPGELTTFFDPEVINILTAPRKARAITGGKEVQKGDATTTSAKFPVMELMGHTEPYNDFVDGGVADFNANWVARDNYLYSTTRRYGDLEEARNAMAKINVSSVTQQAAATAIDVDTNKFYFQGVAGLRNYGILNDPALNPPLAPAPTGAGGSPLWADKTTQQIYEDILSLFGELVEKTQGIVQESDPLVLAMSPALKVLLAKPTDFNVSVQQMLNNYFSNLTIVTAPEYATAGGQFMQMFATSVDGADTLWLAFSEKMYAFAPVRGTSSIMQKFRAGTFGAIIRRPAAIAAMLGM